MAKIQSICGIMTNGDAARCIAMTSVAPEYAYDYIQIDDMGTLDAPEFLPAGSSLAFESLGALCACSRYAGR